MTAFITSFLFVVLAEMADKTQLLAMAFATKYKAHKVLIAVFLATILNHALAVVLGRFLTKVIPIDVISFIAALSFVIFGLWTIHGDKLEGQERRETRFGPIITVGIAFFLAEMGDKTQLATISLAVKYQSIFSVLLATTLGMVVADSFGIIFAVVMAKHIPKEIIKWISAVIFILFGLVGVYQVLIYKIPIIYLWLIILAIINLSIYFIKHLSKES